jgi:hypothetical protein
VAEVPRRVYLKETGENCISKETPNVNTGPGIISKWRDAVDWECSTNAREVLWWKKQKE